MQLSELRVLIVEDSESDAALIQHDLQSLGYHLVFSRVENASELREQLVSDWDVILSDFRLPQFNAITALEVLKESGKDIPFIVVSQAIGEGVAVELMRSGAADYVMKSSLKRLGPAVVREIREARVRAQAREDAELLRLNEKKFRLLAENSADMVSRHNLAGVYLYASPSFERVMGYAPVTLIGRSPVEFVHPEDLPTVIAAQNQIIQAKPEIRLELRMRKAQGDYLWVEMNSRVIPDPITGKPLEVQSTTRDITEKKKSQILLQESERQYRTLINQLQVGVLIQGPNGEIILGNPRAYELLGFTEAELLGKRSVDQVWNVIHEDGSPFPAHSHPVPVAISTREKVNNVVMGVYRPRTNDLVWLLVDAVPELDHTGAVHQVICTFKDLSERKRAEQAIVEGEARFKSIIESQINGVIVVSTTGTITVANESAAAILTLRAVDVVGKNFAESGYWQQLDANYNPIPPAELPVIIALRERKSVQNFEHAIRFRNGSTKWLSMSASPLYDPTGALTGAVASFVDITDQHTAQQKIQRQLERLRLQEKAINSSMSGVIIADARLPDTPVTFINDAFTGITGYTAKDVIGRNCRFLQGADKEQEGLRNLREALKKKEAGEFNLINFRKNGEMFNCKLQLAPVRDEMGQVTHFVAIQTDVTEKYRAEQEIETTRERLELALAGADLGLIDVDLLKNSIYYNERALQILGYSREELAEMPGAPWCLCHTDDREIAEAQHRTNLIGSNDAFNFELRVLHKLGYDVWISARGRVVERNQKGMALRMVGTILDISERKRHEAQIRELSQQILDISEVERAEISSELHDVIGQSLVLLKLNLLKFLREKDMRTDENEKVLLEPVAETLNKVREISRRLTPSHMKKVGLQLAVEDMLESAQMLSGIEIHADLSALDGFFPDNWSIPCYRVVQEAVTNALKHSGATRIDISTVRIEQNLEIIIADNGKGFAEESDANGIGFTLMRERIRGLRGHLFVNSSGKGVELHVLIPSQKTGG